MQGATTKGIRFSLVASFMYKNTKNRICMRASHKQKSVAIYRQLNRYRITMIGALLIFSCRVCAQLIQYVFGLSWLPPFEAWHSATLNYGVLVLSQFIIIGVGLYAIKTSKAALLKKTPKRHRIEYLIVSFGVLYLIAMVGRLIGGLFIVPDHAWFSARLPTFFHFVLATFVITWGRHMSLAKRVASESSELEFDDEVGLNGIGCTSVGAVVSLI